MGLLDLVALVGPEIDHTESVLLALKEIVKLVLRCAPAYVGLGGGVGGDAGKAVEEDALLRGVEAR